MRFSAALALQSLVVLAFLASGCDSPDESAASSARESSPSSAGTTSGASPTCSAEKCAAERRAERKAERRAEQAQRCRDFLDKVDLTYRITATPAEGGSEIGLHMILVNRSQGVLSGSTAGALRVAPGPPSNRISWGGSSADDLWVKPGTTTRREVWHERRPPGWHPVGDRVTSFHFYTYTYGPRPGFYTCFIPATIVAPRGLVDAHASGRWSQKSDP